MNLHDVRPTPHQIIKQHIPSMSDLDEQTILTNAYGVDDELDAADLALRTCHCGQRIDGFYEYVDHLTTVLHEAGYE